ncbi:MAG: starch-binding protein [Treponema sp.]|nr:starch-binding protein [Treponema sp.]
MKKCYSFCAIFSVIFTLLFASYNEENHSSESDTEYGSLTVNGSEASARSLVVGDITYARVSVTGDDITNAITSDYVSSSGGKGNVSISKVPVGTNRIVTVQAFDKDKQIIDGAVVSAVVDVKAGENSCTVTQETTALANVCTKLKALGKSLRSVETETIKKYIDTDTSWALVDTDKIASDYVNGSLSEKKTDYIKASGTVQITSAVSDSYRIQITDPSSEVRDLYASTKMLDSAPGTWKILVLDGSSVVASDTIKVVSGQTTTVTVGKVSGGVESGKIIAHVPSSYGYTYAHYWGGDVAATNWPGVSMTKNGDNYDITLEGTKTNIIFNNGGNSK